jgi:hypothetical protein
MAIDYGNPAAAELTWPKEPVFVVGIKWYCQQGQKIILPEF